MFLQASQGNPTRRVSRVHEHQQWHAAETEPYRTPSPTPSFPKNQSKAPQATLVNGGTLCSLSYRKSSSGTPFRPGTHPQLSRAVFSSRPRCRSFLTMFAIQIMQLPPKHVLITRHRVVHSSGHRAFVFLRTDCRSQGAFVHRLLLWLRC